MKRLGKETGDEGLLRAFVDGDWGNDKKTRKSRTGAFVEMNGMLVCWVTCMQTSIALSSTESEYNGIIIVGKIIVWMRNLLSEMGFTPKQPSEFLLKRLEDTWDEAATGLDSTKLMVDNQAAIRLVNNGMRGKNSRHYEIHAHKAAEWVLRGILTVGFVGTEDQPADLLTKALGRTKFGPFLERIMGDPELQSYFEKAIANFCKLPPGFTSPQKPILDPVKRYKASVQIRNGTMTTTIRAGSRKNAAEMESAMGEMGGRLERQ